MSSTLSIINEELIILSGNADETFSALIKLVDLASGEEVELTQLDAVRIVCFISGDGKLEAWPSLFGKADERE